LTHRELWLSFDLLPLSLSSDKFHCVDVHLIIAQIDSAHLQTVLVLELDEGIEILLLSDKRIDEEGSSDDFICSRVESKSLEC
jgi:hypothetical protein